MKNAPNKNSIESALDKRQYNPDGLAANIKSTLLKGCDVRLVDYPPEQRSTAIGILATLRDELPISCRWMTIRESHLSETRLRARTYRIRGEFLHDGGLAP